MRHRCLQCGCFELGKMNPVYAVFLQNALCDGCSGLKLEVQVQLKSTVSSRALEEMHLL